MTDDPNVILAPTDHEYRIYGRNDASVWAVVDAIDYPWLIRHRWNIKSCRANKPYLRRAVSEFSNGVRLRTFSLYLHVEVMKATGIVQPTPNHKLVDHRNGDSLDCRRANLRWATHTMNSRNLYGRYGYDLVDDAMANVL